MPPGSPIGGALLVVMSMGVAVMMIMVAMLVMVMTVVMMMMVIMMMVAMIVRRTIMRRVVVRIALGRMGVAAAGIGAAFGIEWRLDLDHARAEPLHHRLDDVIAPDPQALGHDLRRQMAVAEMPGDPNQMVRVGAFYLEQRLRRRHDFDQTSIVEHQRVATAQRDRVLQIEQKFKSARAGHRHPPPVTAVEVEHDGIGRRYRPAMLPADLRRADHVKRLTVARPCRR